jgi:predicted transcriptional regulator
MDKQLLEREAKPLEGEPFLTQTRKSVLALAAWAEAQEWPNATDLFAYRAFLDVAYRANTLFVGMSQYQLAEAIGVSNRTAWTAIGRLERRGLLKREVLQSNVTLDKPLSMSYLLVEPDVLQNYVTHSSYPLNCLESRHNATGVPDLFRSKGLRKPALRVYEALDPEQAQTAAELGRKLKRHRSSVGKQLEQLAAFGLAIEAEEGWLKVEADLEKLAEEHGMAGATERMRAYHGRLREGYREYLKYKASGASNAAQSHIQRGRGRLAVCLGCGQVYEFNEATALAYAKCFDCGGSFKWVA